MSQCGLKFGVVILAAGSSSRMGSPKLLLPWRGNRSVIAQLLLRWDSLGARQITVATAPHSIKLNSELDRLNFPVANRILNPHPENGMFSSIQCAARWTGWDPDLTHFAITLGDQPHLKESTLIELRNFIDSHPDKISQPLREGKRRHPVFLPRSLFLRLKDTQATTLKMFLLEHSSSLAGFESSDAGLDLDMDTREDYERLRRDFDGK